MMVENIAACASLSDTIIGCILINWTIFFAALSKVD
jgi:hypothetical protein